MSNKKTKLEYAYFHVKCIQEAKFYLHISIQLDLSKHQSLIKKKEIIIKKKEKQKLLNSP